MKKLSVAVAVILVFAVVLSVSAVVYADNASPVLNDTYKASSVLGETIIDFNEDGTTAIRYLVSGNEVYNQIIRYEINDEETELSMEFADETGNYYIRVLPFDRARYGIVIDEHYYKLVIEAEESTEA